MSFLETPRFPVNISYGATGGPGYKTDVVTVNSGYEQRNITWTTARAMYDVAHAARTSAQMTELINFFRAVKGRAHGFRFKDWADYSTTTATGKLGTGVGNGTATYQLRKYYAAGALYEYRDITKPVTVAIYRNGILLAQGSGAGQYSINMTTGIVTIVDDGTSDQYPQPHETLTWAGEFDVPCRFDTDQIKVDLIAPDVQGWGSIPIVEIRV